MQLRPLAESAIKQLGLKEPPDVLLARVDITGVGQTNVVTIHATDGDPAGRGDRQRHRRRLRGLVARHEARVHQERCGRGAAAPRRGARADPRAGPQDIQRQQGDPAVRRAHLRAADRHRPVLDPRPEARGPARQRAARDRLRASSQHRCDRHDAHLAPADAQRGAGPRRGPRLRSGHGVPAGVPGQHDQVVGRDREAPRRASPWPHPLREARERREAPVSRSPSTPTRSRRNRTGACATPWTS